MVAFSELSQTEATRIMVFGDSGTGKSTLASKLAMKHKLIWLSCDNGHSVLNKLTKEAQDNIDIIVIPDTREAPFAFDTVRKLMKGKPCTVCHMHGVVNCTTCKTNGLPSSSYELGKLDINTVVVVDHLTSVTDSCMAVVCRNTPVDYKPKLDDWGSLKFNLTELLKDIQVAKFNVVCIAQAMLADQEDGSKKLTPSVGSYEFGKLVANFFDHVIYTSVQNKTHRVGSSSTYMMNVTTKSRTDVEIEKLKELSLEPFLTGSVVAAKKREDNETSKKLLEKLPTISEGTLNKEETSTVEVHKSTADKLAEIRARLHK